MRRIKPLVLLVVGHVEHLKALAARDPAAVALVGKHRKDLAQVRLVAGPRVTDCELVTDGGAADGTPDVDDAPSRFSEARGLLCCEVLVEDLLGAVVGLVLIWVRNNVCSVCMPVELDKSYRCGITGMES